MFKIENKFSQELKKMGIEKINDMQSSVFSSWKNEKDMILLSPTGSGKTLAFLLPILDKLSDKKKGIKLLIMVPARELAIQIDKVVRQLFIDYKTTVCYGGHPVRVEKNNLKEVPDILIGTPGRLLDHLRRGNFELSSLDYIVVDEFDKLLELGFKQELEAIFSEIPNNVQKTLTSATNLKDEIPKYLKFRASITTLDFLEESSEIKLSSSFVRAEGVDKLAVLFELLCNCGSENTLVFCNHRDAVDRISELLHIKGVYHDIFHGGLSQEERERALIKFRNGSIKILLATDLASRGLDIPEIKNVIHYQLPSSESVYIHRNGRTARMHRSGQSILVLAKDDYKPEFIKEDIAEFPLKLNQDLPSLPEYSTIYLGGGKKDKINKVDIVGFFCKQLEFENKDLGKIEVKDFHSFVAVKRIAYQKSKKNINKFKIKKKTVKIQLSK
ncbi:MAG: DEAD/DEAH box helicase [Bacteroidales bacterium]